MRKPRIDTATTLAAWWDLREPSGGRQENGGRGDLMVGFPRSSDGHFLSGFFTDDPRFAAASTEGRSFVQELEHRGYDLSTLRILHQKEANVINKVEGHRDLQAAADGMAVIVRRDLESYARSTVTVVAGRRTEEEVKEVVTAYRAAMLRAGVDLSRVDFAVLRQGRIEPYRETP